MSNDIRLLSDPLDLFTGWGWCEQISKILWNNNIIKKNSINHFQKYIKQIEGTIKFQCVLMARFNWGILFIDVCDSAQWELQDIDEPYIYLKAQYDPTFKYQNNVLPFTYAVQEPLKFHNNIDKYKQQYLETYKTNFIYGRWCGISLDRYNLAKKMRSIGIMTGGEYCLVERGYGYENHEVDGLLDTIKPREKMGWDEYFRHQCFALSCLDACGFGDLTHRMVESFAIGIPVIRPKLKNKTFDPILENEHYLDCGSNGEYLIDCMEKIKDPYCRNKLINNGLDWYENNASPSGFYNLLLKLINNQIKLSHIYKRESFGEDWFSYPDLYKKMVSKFPSGSHFVEVGSWKGKSSSYMAVEIANSNKNIKFDCIDTWEGSPEHGDSFKNNDLLYNIFLTNMKPAEKYFNPIRMRSDEAFKLYPDQSLDFVFIDAEHSYEAVKQDIINWLPKVKKGGILAGHDYYDWKGVFDAVNELLGENNIETMYGCWVYNNINILC